MLFWWMGHARLISNYCGCGTRAAQGFTRRASASVWLNSEWLVSYGDAFLWRKPAPLQPLRTQATNAIMAQIATAFMLHLSSPNGGSMRIEKVDLQNPFRKTAFPHQLASAFERPFDS